MLINVNPARFPSIFPRIRDLREDSDLTQQNIADYLHRSQSLYTYYIALAKRAIDNFC